MGILLTYALVASSVATESAAAFVNSSAPQASIHLKGSHGYPIHLQVARGFATAAVTEPGRRGLSAPTSEYVAFGGRATVDGAKASFGRFGKLAVRFLPSGKVRRSPVPEFCSGNPEFTRFGVFEGTIRFRGEGGYTEVDISRARGSVSATPRQVCHFPKREDRPDGQRGPRKQPKALLATTLTATQASMGIDLSAVRSEQNPTAAILIATSIEPAGHVSVFRRAFVAASKDVFAFDPALNTATLTPPYPFAGSATFQRIDDYTTRWEGPLTVSFPGRPDVALTGRGFTCSLDSAKEQAGSISVSFGTGFAGVG